MPLDPVLNLDLVHFRDLPCFGLNLVHFRDFPVLKPPTSSARAPCQEKERLRAELEEAGEEARDDDEKRLAQNDLRKGMSPKSR